MKTQFANVKSKSNRLLKALLFCAAALPFAMSVSGNAQAEECQPLQVTSILPLNAHLTNNGRSFAFYLNGYVQNRNPGVYLGSSRAWMSMHFKNNAGQTQAMQKVTFGTHIAPRNGKERFVGDSKYVFNGTTAPSWIVTFEAMLVNEQCQDPKKRFAKTVVRYDFRPVLSGGKPKVTLSGAPRILLDGASSVSPRPRPGNGAPQPRSRT